MKLSRLYLAAGLTVSLGIGGYALAQTIPVPQVQSIGPTDLFQDVVGGTPQAGNVYASGAVLAGSFGNSGVGENFLIGGRAMDNLWQTATTGASTTTTVGYYSADRWVLWSGTNTAVTLSRVTTAAALPTGSQYAFRMQRTAAQTGVVQICMAQEITSQNSYYLAGHTVELDFNVYTGANFSATAMNAYIIYGTGSDEGTTNLAFGLNAGGGGGAGWTGQANATAGLIPLSAVSTASRVVSVGTIPTTATEVAVALCWTPVGTAGTTDALYFDNIELRKADGLVNFASTTIGYVLGSNGTSLSATISGLIQNAVIPAYSKRQAQFEALLQYAYKYIVPEVDTAGAVQGPAGVYDTTTTCSIAFPLPVQMRAVPTLIGTSAIGGYNALSATTFKINPTTTAVVLATPFAALQTGASSTTVGVVSFKTTVETANTICVLQSTAAGAGAFGFSAEL